MRPSHDLERRLLRYRRISPCLFCDDWPKLFCPVGRRDQRCGPTRPQHLGRRLARRFLQSWLSLSLSLFSLTEPDRLHLRQSAVWKRRPPPLWCLRRRLARHFFQSWLSLFLALFSLTEPDRLHLR